MNPKNEYNNTQNRSTRQRKNNGPCESKERCCKAQAEQRRTHKKLVDMQKLRENSKD